MPICRGCLLVRQSFFHNDAKNFADVGGGVLGCRGFHSSFRTTQSGLSLNIGMFCMLTCFLVVVSAAGVPFFINGGLTCSF